MSDDEAQGHESSLWKIAEDYEERQRVEEERLAWELNPNRPLLERQKREKEKKQEEEWKERELQEAWERVDAQKVRKPYFNHKY